MTNSKLMYLFSRSIEQCQPKRKNTENSGTQKSNKLDKTTFASNILKSVTLKAKFDPLNYTNQPTHTP